MWSQLAEALNVKFMASTGSGLSAEQVHYLGSKLFADEYTGQLVTWSQFNREPLPGRNFTFWEWFYAILKLTKDWLQGPWKERLIHGFISKQDAQNWLKKYPRGTFLLRFSDSEIGGITIAWVDDDPNKPGEKQVWNLAPFTDKDFKIRGLGDRIKDIQNLTHLYPDIPKTQAFGKFWTQAPDSALPSAAGYVRPDITTVIPGLSNRAMSPMSYDDPQTPQAQAPQSPQSTAYCDSQQPSSNSADHTMDHEQQDFPDFFTMDYNPEDITAINVNELLQMRNEGNM